MTSKILLSPISFWTKAVREALDFGITSFRDQRWSDPALIGVVGSPLEGVGLHWMCEGRTFILNLPPECSGAPEGRWWWSARWGCLVSLTRLTWDFYLVPWDDHRDYLKDSHGPAGLKVALQGSFHKIPDGG